MSLFRRQAFQRLQLLWPYSGSLRPARSVHFNRFSERRHTVALDPDDPDGTIFECDEESHMLGPPFSPGYMPLKFGDVLRSKKGGDYEILRKLGWGANSSVWLARKSQDRKFYAIKALSASSSSRLLLHHGYEFEVLVRVDKDTSMPRHPGRSHCTLLQDLIVGKSQHGGHMCFVFLPCSISLSGLVHEGSSITLPRRLALPTVIDIIRQTLLAVSYVHSLEIAHTDIQASNLFISIANRDEDIEKWLIENPSETYPPRHELALSPEPIITAQSEALPPFGPESSRDMTFHLGDFGEAIPVEHIDKDRRAMPIDLRAPELLIGAPWTKSVDIWAIGCLAFELITRSTIFNLDAPSDVSFTEVHLARITELLGPFPDTLLYRGTENAALIDETGHAWKPLHDLPLYGDLLSRLMQGGLHDVQKLGKTANFIRRCLEIEPSLRPTAQELLQDDWIIDGASW